MRSESSLRLASLARVLTAVLAIAGAGFFAWVVTVFNGYCGAYFREGVGAGHYEHRLRTLMCLLVLVAPLAAWTAAGARRTHARVLVYGAAVAGASWLFQSAYFSWVYDRAF